MVTSANRTGRAQSYQGVAEGSLDPRTYGQLEDMPAQSTDRPQASTSNVTECSVNDRSSGEHGLRTGTALTPCPNNTGIERQDSSGAPHGGSGACIAVENSTDNACSRTQLQVPRVAIPGTIADGPSCDSQFARSEPEETTISRAGPRSRGNGLSLQEFSSTQEQFPPQTWDGRGELHGLRLVSTRGEPRMASRMPSSVTSPPLEVRHASPSPDGNASPTSGLNLWLVREATYPLAAETISPSPVPYRCGNSSGGRYSGTPTPLFSSCSLTRESADRGGSSQLGRFNDKILDCGLDMMGSAIRDDSRGAEESKTRWEQAGLWKDRMGDHVSKRSQEEPEEDTIDPPEKRPPDGGLSRFESRPTSEVSKWKSEHTTRATVSAMSNISSRNPSRTMCHGLSACESGGATSVPTHCQTVMSEATSDKARKTGAGKPTSPSAGLDPSDLERTMMCYMPLSAHNFRSTQVSQDIETLQRRKRRYRGERADVGASSSIDRAGFKSSMRETTSIEGNHGEGTPTPTPTHAASVFMPQLSEDHKVVQNCDEPWMFQPRGTSEKSPLSRTMNGAEQRSVHQGGDGVETRVIRGCTAKEDPRQPGTSRLIGDGVEEGAPAQCSAPQPWTVPLNPPLPGHGKLPLLRLIDEPGGSTFRLTAGARSQWSMKRTRGMEYWDRCLMR